MSDVADMLPGLETKYDPEADKLTVFVHGALIRDPKSRDALLEKIAKAIDGLSIIEKVDVVERK